jgi:DNA-binding PadR family transcriptional regulator
VLEDAGYLEVRKSAVGRRPRTWFRLTAAGRQAVEGHLAWLAQLEEGGLDPSSSSSELGR